MCSARFFGLLTLMAYTRYVQKSEVQKPEVRRKQQTPRFTFTVSRFWLGVVCYALGLMCKPMLVTLPFVLLLLDYWPLQRMRNAECGMRNLKTLVLEKIPFFALAAVMSVVTS